MNSRVPKKTCVVAVGPREDEIQALGQVIAERDRAISERNGQIAELLLLLTQHEATSAEYERTLADRDGQIEKLKQLLADRDEQLDKLQRLATECDQAIAEVIKRGEWAVQLQTELASARNSLSEVSLALDATRRSTSWRITAPFRAIRCALPTATVPQRTKLRNGVWRLLRNAYHSLPLAQNRRLALQHIVYNGFPGFFSGMPSFELWKARQPAMHNSELRSSLSPALSSSPSRPVHAPETSPHVQIATASSDAHTQTMPSFPAGRQPLASIIIPVYGKIEFTLQCLRSIAALRTCVSFEVIVVDDCSPDDTLDQLDKLSGIRVLRNASNRGFIRSCNAGAAAAAGEFLVFLNNDTEVLEGWLDALINTFSTFPSAGLVGSKLLYPDGRLQEAGGLIWNDASGWNCGRLDAPDKPEYNYVRDVDYCSGASIAIRRVLFDELGRFDERYVPAYFEDADLAFAVRQAGYRVLYQPASQLIHHEGVTSGTDPSSGAKAYQVTNRGKFLDKWAARLMTHRSPGEEPRLERDRFVRGRILIIDATTPTPDQDAGSVTAAFFQKIFTGLGYKVTFAPENLVFIDGYTQPLQQMGVECLYVPHTPTIREFLKEHGREFDFVMLYRVWTAHNHLKDVKRYCPQAKLIFDTVDLHYLREERQAALTGSQELARQAARTKEVELGLMQTADVTIVLSEAEADLLQKEDPNLRLCTIPLLLEMFGSRTAFADRRDIVFIGGFQHTPNIDAVEYFVEEIWPYVRKALPDARFLIIGSKMPERIAALSQHERVIPIGFVQELSEYFDRCKLTVVPLRFGAGIKGKIGTSASYGVPTVGTTVAVEGMGLQDGTHVLVADEPELFAAQVVRLYTNEKIWTDLSSNAFSFVNEHYSLTAGKRRLEGLLRSLGGEPQAEIEIAECRSLDEFVSRKDRLSDIFSSRCIGERGLIAPGERPFTVDGTCKVCGANHGFIVDYRAAYRRFPDGLLEPNWRESLVCVSCGMNNRVRAAADLFVNHLLPNSTSRIYTTEQLTPFYTWLKKAFPQAIGSEFLGGDHVGGEEHNGIRHEDLTALSFRDQSLDFIVSFDVFEHIPNYKKALHECLRCLARGGTLFFSVPFLFGQQSTAVRATVSEAGEVEHILPPEFHGNPTRPDEGSLCFYHFGWDLLQSLLDAGATDAYVCSYYSRPFGNLGAEQLFFVARR